VRFLFFKGGKKKEGGGGKKKKKKDIILSPTGTDLRHQEGKEKKKRNLPCVTNWPEKGKGKKKKKKNKTAT